jgi:hypothetical protein
MVWRISGLIAVCFLTGCGTSFKYNPKYGQSFSTISESRGVEIAGGVDQRPEDEKQPQWNKPVEVIVARALADEIQHDGLFRKVKVHLSGPARLNKFSYYIEFRVDAFRMLPRNGMAEQIGRTALGALGWRGALISASIPTTWESQVSVTFEVFDARSKWSLYSRSYSESKSLKANGYQGDSRQIQQTSDCLEAVVKRFVADFSHVAASVPPLNR